jgi:hypothetical protein
VQAREVSIRIALLIAAASKNVCPPLYTYFDEPEEPVVLEDVVAKEVTLDTPVVTPSPVWVRTIKLFVPPSKPTTTVEKLLPPILTICFL